MKGNIHAMQRDAGAVQKGAAERAGRGDAVSLADHKRRAGQNVGAKTSAGYQVTTTFPNVSLASSTRWA